MAELKIGTTIDGEEAFNLPIGTVLIYDGAGWIDNSTLPGWYACIPENTGYGVISYVDRFAIGHDITVMYQSSSNSKQISILNLPRHAHNTNHQHSTLNYTTGSVIRWDVDHYEYNHLHFLDRSPDASVHNADNSPGHYPNASTSYLADTNYTPHNHSYTYLVGSLASDYGEMSVRDQWGNSVSYNYYFDGRPSYYSAIYIRRCI